MSSLLSDAEKMGQSQGGGATQDASAAGGAADQSGAAAGGQTSGYDQKVDSGESITPPCHPL